MNAPIVAAGYEPYTKPPYMRTRGHSMALGSMCPEIAPNSDEVLLEGMVFVMHPNQYIPETGYIMCGEPVIITPDGAQPLTSRMGGSNPSRSDGGCDAEHGALDQAGTDLLGSRADAARRIRGTSAPPAPADEAERARRAGHRGQHVRRRRSRLCHRPRRRRRAGDGAGRRAGDFHRERQPRKFLPSRAHLDSGAELSRCTCRQCGSCRAGGARHSLGPDRHGRVVCSVATAIAEFAAGAVIVQIEDASAVLQTLRATPRPRERSAVAIALGMATKAARAANRLSPPAHRTRAR